MKALFYQCGSGISGDMNLGALVDIGVPAEYLRKELSRLPVHDEFELRFEQAEKMGIYGTRATVIVRHAHHHHGHHHDHDHHHPPHRGYREIKRLIDESPYGESVRQRVDAMFRRIGEAEARIHGTTIDQIHFHEVGATDSIVDVFGAAIALDYLGVEAVFSSAVEVGSGHVKCAHGTFPVPAPATAEILRNIPCRYGTVDGEATTPTGAAILATCVTEFEPTGTFVAEKVGYGIGQRDFAIPNVLRVMLGEVRATTEAPAQEPTNYEITANIDDMSAEAFDPLIERLFRAGASDVFLTPIVMKKSRLAQMVTILCQARHRDTLVDILFANSSTIGVRMQPVAKRMLPRRIETVETSHGPVQVKIVDLPQGGRRWKVEHDDVVRAARDGSYTAVRRAIEAEVAAVLDERP